MSVRASVVAAVSCWWLLSCGPGDAALPADLLQVWRNPNPGYRDRYFELREGRVVFGTGGLTMQIHVIQSVEATPDGSSTEYLLEYRGEDGASVPLRIVYTPGPPAGLTLGHRKDTWVPESRAHWLKDGSS